LLFKIEERFYFNNKNYMKIKKIVGLISITIASMSSFVFAGTSYTDVIGVTTYSSGVTSNTDALGYTHFSNGLTAKKDSLGVTQYTNSSNINIGSSYVDGIGVRHFTFSDGTTITSKKDGIGNIIYSDGKGNSGTSYTDSLGYTHYSGNIFNENKCEYNQTYNSQSGKCDCMNGYTFDSYLNKCTIAVPKSSLPASCASETLSVIKSKYGISEQEVNLKSLKVKISDLQYQKSLVPSQVQKESVGLGRTQSGVDSIVNERVRELDKKISSLNLQLEEIYSKYNSDLNLVTNECALSVSKLPESSYSNQNTSNILCASGYTLIGSSCIENSLNCANQFGKSSYFENGSCKCMYGFKMDEMRGKCVSNTELVCPLNSSPLNGKCSCDAGTISDNSNNCVPLTVYCQIMLKTTVAKDGLSCVCPQGQLFNKVNNTCTAGSAVVSSSVAIFNRTLKKGMIGSDVKNLQLLLVKLKYLPETRVATTIFDTATNNALIKFQKDNKIQPATGSFGPATQTKLLSLTKS
jgi:hypothetical protein